MGPVISANQAQKQWSALPDYAKKVSLGAPMGFQQYATPNPERYLHAGVAPGWYNPALNPRTQMKKLEGVERAKFGPKPAPADTRKFGAGVDPSTLFQSNLQGLLQALTRGSQSIQQNQQNNAATAAFSPQIQSIRDEYINSLL